MKRRDACVALGAALAAASGVPVVAQQTRVARVAWTSVDRANPQSPFLASFRAAMRQLGWVEGRNLAIETWWGGGSMDGLKKQIAEILAAKPDVVVTAGGGATRGIIDAGVTLPIAFTVSADAVIGKFVESWARPGVNRTGISFFALELIPKRMELMREVLPAMKRMAIVGWPPHAGELLELDAARTAADRMKIEHRYFGPNNGPELDAALEAVAEWKADAILAFAGGISATYPDRFAAFSVRRRIPAFSAWALFADAGNLMTYGPVLEECYARLAWFVDRILKGARPAEIPVERPTKFETVLNLKAAKSLGIAIPQSVLLRADRVIE